MKVASAVVVVCLLSPIVSAQHGEHANPPLRCADRIGHYEEVERYTYPYQRLAHGPAVERSFADMMTFCEAIEAEFSAGTLMAAEAEELYDALGNTLVLVDGSIGFPSGDYRPPPVELRDRVALSARGSGGQGVYFWRTGCGVVHSLHRATVHPDGHVELEREETWGVSYPC